MVARKLRIPGVVDTNVFVRNFKRADRSSPNCRVYRLWWLERRLQLIVSPELIHEYLEVFERVLGIDRHIAAEWRKRFEHDRRCTVVNLARRYAVSRDPDDNLVLATALAGRAEYLITNDRDLLELPGSFQRSLPFEILTPAAFLHVIGEG